jgi:hypothetical protein
MIPHICDQWKAAARRSSPVFWHTRRDEGGKKRRGKKGREKKKREEKKSVGGVENGHCGLEEGE